MPIRGAIRLFRLWGVDIFLHWTWLIVAVFAIQMRQGIYQSIAWNILEYLSLFGIVLMHEMGHALACRQVGGTADKIMLWPLGGIAFVNPPPRPGALLWSIAAGPLVNVALLPVTIGLYFLASTAGGMPADLTTYLNALAWVNFWLLAFNLIPIYPLDGGQILRAALWYFVGPIRSLRSAAYIGIGGIIIGVILVTLGGGNLWLYIIAAFAALQCFVGLQQARLLEERPELLEQGGAAQPRRRPQIRCPACHHRAPIGPFWRCVCGEVFDTFERMGTCPRCERQHYVTACPDCQVPSPLAAWYGPGSGFPVIFQGPMRPLYTPPPVFNSGESIRRDPQPPL
jgi:Zn-dependent protease